VDGRVINLHTAQHHFHSHSGEWFLGSLASKNKLALLRFGSRPHDGNSAGRQRNAMLTACLHSAGRYDPNFLIPVDLRLPNAKHLTRSTRSEDAELKS
jgi:hypothetical protein